MVFGADSADLSGNRRSSSSGLSSRHTPGAEVSILVGASRGTDAPILPSLRSLRVLGPAPSRAGAGAAREGKGQAEQVAPVGPSSSPAWLAGGLLSHPRAASPEGMKIPRSSHSGWFCQATSSGVWLLHTVGVAWAYGLLSCPWGSPQAPPGGAQVVRGKAWSTSLPALRGGRVGGTGSASTSPPMTLVPVRTSLITHRPLPTGHQAATSN